jgi:hypothetical protein
MDISALAKSLVTSAFTQTGTTYENNSTGNYDNYIKLHSGVIIQWGYIYDTSAPREVQFPTEFPTCFSAGVCASLRGSSGSQGFNHIINANRTRMTVILDSSAGFWIAMGH